MTSDEIQNYVDTLDKKIGLKPETVKDVRKTLNKRRSELKTHVMCRFYSQIIIKMEKVRMYFKGDSGIKKPSDLNGNAISEGDILTIDYGDFENAGIAVGENYSTTPFYKVKVNEKGGFYAESINPIGGNILDGDKKYFYLHDFRFKFCVKLS